MIEYQMIHLNPQDSVLEINVSQIEYLVPVNTKVKQGEKGFSKKSALLGKGTQLFLELISHFKR